jgi:deoxycytidylate deaminase
MAARLLSIIETFKSNADTYDSGTIAIILTPDYERFTYINRGCYEGLSIHAEVQAINAYYAINGIKQKKQRNQHIKKYDLLVFRINNCKKILNARPCRDCAQTIYNCGIINRVFYINEIGSLQVHTPQELLIIATPLLLQKIIDFKNGAQKKKSRKYFQKSPRLHSIARQKIIKHDLGELRSPKPLAQGAPPPAPPEGIRIGIN